MTYIYFHKILKNINKYITFSYIFILLDLMEKQLIRLYNNGSNKGDVTILSKYDEQTTCHSFVIEMQTSMDLEKYLSGSPEPLGEDLATLKRGLEPLGEDTKYLLKIYRDTHVIIAMMNKLYSSDYIFTNLSVDDIIELFLFANDENWKFKNSDGIKKELVEIFSKQLATNNWYTILEKILQLKYSVVEELVDAVVDYFLKKVMPTLSSFDELKIDDDVKKFLMPYFKSLNKMIATVPETIPETVFNFGVLNKFTGGKKIIIDNNSADVKKLFGTDRLFYGFDNLKMGEKLSRIDQIETNLLQCKNHISYLKIILSNMRSYVLLDETDSDNEEKTLPCDSNYDDNRDGEKDNISPEDEKVDESSDTDEDNILCNVILHNEEEEEEEENGDTIVSSESEEEDHPINLGKIFKHIRKH